MQLAHLFEHPAVFDAKLRCLPTDIREVVGVRGEDASGAHEMLEKPCVLDLSVGCLWLVLASGSGTAGASAGDHAATLVCSMSREARSARCTSVIETMPKGRECSSMTTARPTLAKAGRSRSLATSSPAVTIS